MNKANLFSTVIRRLIAAALIGLIVASCTPSAEFTQPPGTARAVLVDGLGVYSRSISTNSAATQEFFDQGLNLTFGYYFVHAAASFQEAIRHDPDSPMPYWGLALAVGPNPNSRYMRLTDDPRGEGKRAIDTAMGLRDKATRRERDFIETLHVRYDEETYPDRDVRNRAYIDATRALYARYAADPDTGFLYADAIMTASPWNYWDAEGHPRLETMEAAAALERSMKLELNHPGANHLYIHLFEASPTPARALPQADRLAATMPNAGHIVHMPSHIYLRVGQYVKAIETNQRSLDADRFLLEAWGNHPFPMICSMNSSARGHGGHASDFIRLGATFQGNYAEAIEYARRVASSPRFSRDIAAVWLVHKAFGRWDELDREAVPATNDAYLQGMWRYVHGSKYARQQDLAAAELALLELRQFQAHPDLQDRLIMVNPGADVLAIAVNGLAGEIALARRDLDAAISAFREAVEREDRLGYMEPPDWAQSMRLYLGHAYLEAAMPQLAQLTFEEELTRFPENGWALYGLWKSLSAQGKDEPANAVEKRFRHAWRFSDTILTAAVF
jgi:tetratricopeptide (TPR) repeat protein